jgi:hypothetical protein
VIEKWCDLKGPVLRLRADTPDLVTSLISAWGLRQTDARERADFTLSIDRGTAPPIVTNGQPIFDGLMPDGIACRTHLIEDSQYYEIRDRAWLALGRSEGHLVIAPGQENLTHSSVAFQAILAALACGKQYFLHAAAMLLPDKDQALILLGASGAGKTTTTLALLAGGFRFLTDDATIVRRCDDRSEVWGLPLEFKVHQETASLLPWLSPLVGRQWNENGEQPVTIAEVQRQLSLSSPIDKSYPIIGLIALGPRSAGDHRIETIARADLLLAIAKDNLPRIPTGGGESQAERLRWISSLIAAHAGFRLRPGPNLGALPRVVLDALACPS